MKRRLITLALAILPVVVEGQSSPVSAGARVRVTAPGSALKKHVATVTAVHGDSIVVGAKGSSHTLGLADITALDVSTGTRTQVFRDAGMGMGIGIVAGAVIGALSYKECESEELFGFVGCMMAPQSRADAAGLGALVLGAAGLVSGGVVGMFHRTDRWAAVALPVRMAISPTHSGGVSVRISRAF